MSGFGVLLRRGGEILPAEIRRLEDDLRYRGADGVRSCRLGECSLVHAQFATTPEAVREQQPLRHAHQAWWLSSDARIDNRDELRHLLRGRVRHPLDTDADYVMAAYELWGDGLADRLVGDFAGALWNEDRRELILFRDHLGIRPVHWAERQGKFVAGSTLRSVRNQLTGSLDVDTSHVAQFATDRRHSVTDTFWKGVQRLGPGHTLRSSPGRAAAIHTYWDPQPRSDTITVDDAAEGIRSLFDQAIRCHLRSTGPVGVQLSGGYDSTTVLSAVSRLGAGTDAIHSLSFTEPEADEQPYVLAAAKASGAELVTVQAVDAPFVDLADCAALSGSAFRAFDSHWADRLAGLLREQGGRVMLTGHGGDHLLDGGTVAYLDLLRRGRVVSALRQEPSLSRSGLRGLVGGLRALAASEARDGRLAGVPGIRQMVERHDRRRFDVAVATLAPELRDAVAEPFSMNRAGGPWSRSAAQRLHWYRDPFIPFVSEALDHLAAAANVEQRNPFYDRRLVEFGLGLTPDVVRPEGRYRGLHRLAFADDLPVLVAGRESKADFSRPIAATAAHVLGPTESGRTVQQVDDWANTPLVLRTFRQLGAFAAGGPEPPHMWASLGMARLAAWRSYH